MLSAVLLFCARGPVFPEAAVLTALQKKDIAGAALDVYEREPEVDDQYKKLSNVILTPHIGNASIEARDAMGKIVANTAIAAIKGTTIKYIIN